MTTQDDHQLASTQYGCWGEKFAYSIIPLQRWHVQPFQNTNNNFDLKQEPSATAIRIAYLKINGQSLQSAS